MKMLEERANYPFLTQFMGENLPAFKRSFSGISLQATQDLPIWDNRAT